MSNRWETAKTKVGRHPGDDLDNYTPWEPFDSQVIGVTEGSHYNRCTVQYTHVIWRRKRLEDADHG